MSRALSRLLIAGGAVGLAAVTFVHWIGGENFWKSESSLHFKIGIIAAVVVAAALAVMSATRPGATGRLGGAVALFAGGGAVLYTLGLSSFHPQFGNYLGMLCGAVITAGGLLAVFDGFVPSVAAATGSSSSTASRPAAQAGGSAQPAGSGSAQPGGGAMNPPSASDLTEALQTNIPPGWYADPSGEHKERLWDGSAWTHEVR
jgi:hypothetical protein